MVYTIFTNEGELSFDRLVDLLDAAEESARVEHDEKTFKIVKRGISWNEHTVYFKEGPVERRFRLLDNGRDIYRASDGTFLEKMIPRFVLQPLLTN